VPCAAPRLGPGPGRQRDLTTVFGPAGDVGRSTPITIGVDGLPIISHYDRDASGLKVTHCSNVFCAVLPAALTRLLRP
jgi:hypothetical protein